MIPISTRKMSKKICLLVTSLSSGGAEKVAANMSVSLSNRGYAVTIVSMQNNITYNYSGDLYNFGLVKEKYGKLKAFFKFKTFFKQHEFDVIIDHRLRNKYIKELVFSKLVFNRLKVVYCVHNYHLHYYFSFLNTPWLARIPHAKQHSFVAVCNAIQHHLKQELSITSKAIYNYVNTSQLSIPTQISTIPENYIIGVGRLTKIKQFDVLIESYLQSDLPHHNIKLLILGDGPEKKNLEDLINTSSCKELIELKPFIEQPYPLIKKAKALVLSSKFEGFPMVLLEGLALHTPLIAFDCKSGPNEIITHNVDGILVENQNKQELILALSALLNEEFYKKIKANMALNSERFSEDTIIQEWENVFDNTK